MYSLSWLAVQLRAAGLKVVEVAGWQNRGRAEFGPARGVLMHHTATPKGATNMPTLNTLIRGRADLPGPLANLGVGRDGTFYVVAAGRANHAGRGLWHGVVNGNSSLIGIEAENSGLPDNPWPAIQMDALARGVAALCRFIPVPATMVAGHKEYALPKGRKPDPSFDMDAFRARVAALL